MKQLKKSFLLFTFVGLFLTSCDELGKLTEPQKVSTQPQFNGSYSVLWALNTKTTVNTGGIDLGIGETQIDFGTAVASFVDGGKNVSVGKVKVDDTELKMESNKVYLSPVVLTNPTGLTFGNSVSWSIEGGNGFAAMSYVTKKKFPIITGLTADATVDRAASYTVSITSVSNADSIFYGVNDVYKIVAGNIKSVTFTSSQLSDLKKGSAFVQVAPYNFEIKKNGTRDVVFGNQVVVSKLVTIK